MTPFIGERITYDIKSLLAQGLSTREIATKVGVSKTTVQKVRSQNPSMELVPKFGRPKKLSRQDVRYCVRAITSGKVETATNAAKLLKESLYMDVSRLTVARALKEQGLDSAEKQAKPKLSRKNVKARLEFAQRHRNWTIDDWKCVIWSDESKISRFCSDGRSWYWKRDGEGEQSRHVKQTVKGGGGSLMVWGCMTAQGPGFMCNIGGKMDQEYYKSILEDELMRTIEWYKLNPKKVIFQHDNDPKHRAKSVQEWLAKQPFEVLEWPAQSPDLNPIEHLWATLKRRLNKYETPPNGMLEFWDRVQDVWNAITREDCMRLVESMPRRVESVIKAGGWWTKY
jgi:transposase